MLVYENKNIKVYKKVSKNKRNTILVIFNGINYIKKLSSEESMNKELDLLIKDITSFRLKLKGYYIVNS